MTPMLHLILLPGMDGTGELFAPLLAELPLELPVTIVHYPDRPATLAEHVAAARTELPRDAPCVLLGESFSGPVAVSLAAEGRVNVRGVILCASFLRCPSALLSALRGVAGFATPKLVPRFITERALLGRFATPELRDLQRRAVSHVGSRTLAARLRAMADVDVRPLCRSLDLPSLYLRGMRDALVPARCGDEFVATARRARLVELDAPHMLLQARPREAADAIRGFLAQLTNNLAGAIS